MKKMNFIKDVVLFRNREFIVLSVFTWLIVVCMLIDTAWTCILFYQYLNLKP